MSAMSTCQLAIFPDASGRKANDQNQDEQKRWMLDETDRIPADGGAAGGLEMRERVKDERQDSENEYRRRACHDG